MNIFVLDNDPRVAAAQHCDKHVVKMILETVQMLSTVRDRYGESAPYKPSHKKHPCTLWAGASKENYVWLVQLGLALGKEFESRYGKKHLSSIRLLEIVDPPESMPSLGLTPFAQAMPADYKCADAVEAYRTYYINDKMRFATWTRGASVPGWWPGLSAA